MYFKCILIITIPILFVFFFLNINPIYADDLNVLSIFGAGTWIGYSEGHFQDAVDFSEPIEGVSGGGDIFMEIYPIHYWLTNLGIRGTLCEINYIPTEWIKITAMDFNMDIIGRIKPFQWLQIYGFGGATLTGLFVKYADIEEDVSEEGMGFRYGGGVKGQLKIGNGTEIRFGPEVIIGQLMFSEITYYYQRFNISLEIVTSN